MIDSVIKEKCTGCEACASVCPKNCIAMIPDMEGFKQPIVDNEKCISCKKCVNICPVLNFEKYHQGTVDKKEAYAYRATNDNYRKICSSGGAFLSLANNFVLQGGIVYGAAFNAEFKLNHKSASTAEELIMLAGSKYLQSSINNIYKEIKEKLQQEKKILFFGMTCQVEGLRAYLGREYESLYCVDLICMGIPSPMVWDKYLDTYYNRKNIKKINFKDKRLGWHRFSFYLENKDETSVAIPGFDNYYMQCMFKGYSIRSSCFNCTYKCESKIADITIADCWGCENYVTDLDDNKGLSMVICHSPKSEFLMDIFENTGIVQKFDYENVLKYNSNYNHSTILKDGRDKFYRLMKISPRLAFGIMGQNPNKTLTRRVIEKIKWIRSRK